MLLVFQSDRKENSFFFVVNCNLMFSLALQTVNNVLVFVIDLWKRKRFFISEKADCFVYALIINSLVLA